MDPEELARRLRTARAYAGLRSVEALADAIDEKGLGVKTLRSIEQGTRPAYRRELDAIARACALPTEFFTAEDPFGTTQGRDDERLTRIEIALLEAVAQASGERQAIRELLAQQSEILQKLTRVAEGLPDDDALRMWNEGTQDVLAAAEALQARRSAAAAGRAETPRRREASG